MRELPALERIASLDCLVQTPTRSVGYQIRTHRRHPPFGAQTPAQSASYKIRFKSDPSLGKFQTPDKSASYQIPFELAL